MITCCDFYIDTSKLIDLLIKILGTEDVYYLTMREVRDNTLFNRIHQNIIIVDLQEQPSNFQFYLDKFKNKVNSHLEKTFIFINNSLGKADKDYIAKSFCWHIEIAENSIKDKQKYILDKLKHNNIKVYQKCNFVQKLANNELAKIDNEILSIIVDCKINNTKTINNKYLKKNCPKDNENITWKPDTKTALEQLDDLVGLYDIKKQIHKILNYTKATKNRDKLPMLHMLFKGPSGSGKTEIARLVGQVLKENNILSKGTFTEVSRSDLIAGYVGQTALKTQAIIKKAKGGVLFIDEAYSLATKSEEDFGAECISTLIKGMEDYRQDLCVIFAGYEKEMKELLQSNSGFRSRIQFELTFKNYTAKELYQIFRKMVVNDGYKLSSAISPILLEHFEKARTNENFGNGRYVRSFFEKVKIEQADRVVTNNSNGVNIITKSDVLNVIQNLELDLPKEKNKIGF